MLLLHQYDYQWISSLIFFLNRSFSFEDSIFILNGIATAICLCLFVLFVEKSKLYCTFRRLSSFAITYTHTHVDNGQSDAFVYLGNSWYFSFFLLLCALQWINCIYWSGEPVILFMFSFIYYIQWSNRRKAAGFWWGIFTRFICGAGATLMELSSRMMIEVVFSQWRCHFQWKKIINKTKYRCWLYHVQVGVGYNKFSAIYSV